VSLKWGKAFSSFKSAGKPINIDSTAWVKQLILKVWDYSTSLWKLRNSIVHGSTIAERQEKILSDLRLRVTEEYNSYEQDPFIVSPQFNSLFRKKSLEDRLRMGCDSLSSWLRSVKEAKVYQKVFRASMANSAEKYFPLKSSAPPYIVPHSSKTDGGSYRTEIVKPPSTSTVTSTTQAQGRLPSSSTTIMADFDPG
jgi:hypothetical protein